MSEVRVVKDWKHYIQYGGCKPDPVGHDPAPEPTKADVLSSDCVVMSRKLAKLAEVISDLAVRVLVASDENYEIADDALAQVEKRARESEVLGAFYANDTIGDFLATRGNL